MTILLILNCILQLPQTQGDLFFYKRVGDGLFAKSHKIVTYRTVSKTVKQFPFVLLITLWLKENWQKMFSLQYFSNYPKKQKQKNNKKT